MGPGRHGHRGPVADLRDGLTSVGVCPRRGDGLSPRRDDASPRRVSPTTNRYADTGTTSPTRASPRRQAPIPAARNPAFYVRIFSDGLVGIFSDGQHPDRWSWARADRRGGRVTAAELVLHRAGRPVHHRRRRQPARPGRLRRGRGGGQLGRGHRRPQDPPAAQSGADAQTLAIVAGSVQIRDPSPTRRFSKLKIAEPPRVVAERLGHDAATLMRYYTRVHAARRLQATARSPTW